MRMLRLRRVSGPELLEDGEALVPGDFWRLNRARGALPASAPEHALVLCSDSRQPESIFDPEDRFFLVRTAGNLVDPGLLPPGLEGVVVVGHRSRPGAGCGAVDATAAAARTGERPGHPDLAHILDRCALTPEENLARIGKGLEASGLPAALLLYDHVSAALEELVVPARLSGAAARVRAAAGAFRATRHDPRLALGGISLAEGQNPRAIVLVQVPDALHRLLGGSPEAARYTGPMGVFEVKEGGERLSPGALASLAYAWTHALHGQGSFKDSADSLLLCDSPAGLERLAATLCEGRARTETLAGYLHRAGRLWGLVVERGRFAAVVRFVLDGA